MRDRKNTILAFTLTEMLVAMAIMVIVMAAAVPTVQKLREAMEQSTGVKSIIDAALANARAIAIREQKYAGVRFQQYEGRQYLVLIINDNANTGLANRFRMVDGRKAIVLPENLAIISDQFQDNDKLNDTKAVNFYKTAISGSVIFTPSGKLATHDVWFRGDMQLGKVTRSIEDGTNYPSMTSFRIYDFKMFEKTPVDERWTGYLSTLSSEHISPYTGELIRKE